MSALRWFVSPSSHLLFVNAYLRLCSQHIFLHSPNYVEPILLVLRLASATPMSLWSSNLVMRSSSIQTSSTLLPRFQPCSRYSSFLLMQSQYVVMLFPSPWIFFFSFSFENETDSAGYLVLFSESQHDETLLHDHRLQSTNQQPAEVEISILSQNFHSHFQDLSSVRTSIQFGPPRCQQLEGCS